MRRNLSLCIIANSLTDDEKWTTCLYSRLLGNLTVLRPAGMKIPVRIVTHNNL
jgi:hypothetical protein